MALDELRWMGPLLHAQVTALPAETQSPHRPVLRSVARRVMAAGADGLMDEVDEKLDEGVPRQQGLHEEEKASAAAAGKVEIRQTERENAHIPRNV